MVWYSIDVVVGMILLVALIAFVSILFIKNEELRKELKDLHNIKNDYNKLLHQKKSSEVRLGKIAENLAPFVEGWPFNPNDFRFLGNPVDGISFNEDEIVFVEIKSGNARLTKSQKCAKQLVKEGKVKFATFRVNEDGCLLTVGEDSHQEILDKQI